MESNKKKSKTVLITGGGGFLGTHLSRHFLEHGDEVCTYGRHHYPELADAGATCHVGDVRDFDKLNAACRGIDTVFHIAGLAGVWGPRSRYFEVNVKGTANVIRACIENKVPRLVYTSSPSVVYGTDSLDLPNADESTPYPDSYSAPYPASKAEAEKMVLAANGWEMVVKKPPHQMETDDPVDTKVRRLATCAIRPHLIWGPGDRQIIPRILRRARRGRLRRIGDGENMVHLTHVKNAVMAHALAAERLEPDSPVAGNVYFVTDANPVNLWNWINNLLRQLDIPPVEKSWSYPMAHRIGAVLEVLYKILPLSGEPGMTRFLAAQLAGNHYFNTSRARNDLGYEPLDYTESGMQELVPWLKANKVQSVPAHRLPQTGKAPDNKH